MRQDEGGEEKKVRENGKGKKKEKEREKDRKDIVRKIRCTLYNTVNSGTCQIEGMRCILTDGKDGFGIAAAVI